MMKAVFRIALNVLVWGALIVYLFFAARHCRSQQNEEVLKTVDIVVTDCDRLHTVSPETVRQWLGEGSIPLEGSPLREVNTERIRNLIGSQPFIAGIETWIEQSGVLHIEVSQREPVIRMITDDGYDFYVSHDRWILPPEQGRGEYVPVVTGRFGLPFERGWSGSLESLCADEKKPDENYCFFVKLINFVKLTGDDPFWRDEIVQIVVTDDDKAPAWKEPAIVLIPRVGNHTIALGTPDDAQRKLAKLRLFYDSVLAYEGWDTYKVIDVRNNNQVVCTK